MRIGMPTNKRTNNMANASLTAPTLLDRLRPEGARAALLTRIGAVVAGTLILAISAQIKIPFIPVPATLQTLAVAVLAASLGARLGVATVALYIVEGLAGLPVFAGGGGLHYVFSPTFGFIAGWLVMALIIGRAADLGASRKVLPLFGAMALGDVFAFVTGYLWLVAMSGGAAWIDQSNVLGSAFDIAVRPFIVWDVLKMAFAALTITGGWALVASRKS